MGKERRKEKGNWSLINEFRKSVVILSTNIQEHSSNWYVAISIPQFAKKRTCGFKEKESEGEKEENKWEKLSRGWQFDGGDGWFKNFKLLSWNNVSHSDNFSYKLQELILPCH